MFHTGRKGRSISLQWHFTPTAAPATLIKSLARSTLPGPLRGRLCPFLRWGSGVVPLQRHLPPPEMLGSPPLKSVPLPEACLPSLQQGRSASLPTWGRRPWVAGGFVTTPGPSLSLSAVVRCFLVVTVGQGAQLVHPTALQEITRLSRRAEKQGEPLPSAHHSESA